MNISFENLSYKVEKRNFCGKRGEKSRTLFSSPDLHVTCYFDFVADVKEILKGLSGEFRSCELSGIIGPSGSGKSTMLNILSGYTSNNFAVKVNGNFATQKTIRFKSSYIMQEYNLHKFLTVYETMNFAMNLKVGKRLNVEERKVKVRSDRKHC